MHEGITFVDGKDLYTEYGLYVTFGGWNSFIAWPSLKQYDSNDWQEEDGIEADLSAPRLAGQDGVVSFASDGQWSRFGLFVDYLSDGAYHTFDDRLLGRQFKLRLTQGQSRDPDTRLGFAQLQFANDFSPFADDYKRPELTNGLNLSTTDYTLDDRYLSAYGVRVLKGTLAEVEKTPVVKTALKRDIKTQAGVLYDDKNVVYKAKDVKLSCLMRASSLGELWSNWYALLWDLIQPGERLLYVDANGQEFPCCYKSCSVEEFYPTGKIWLRFSLTVTFLHDFRIDDNPCLADEEYIWMSTEAGDCLIDMAPIKNNTK